MEGGGESAGPKLPPLPADGLEMGVLPRVIRTLVERRAVVKRMLKKEKASFLAFFFSCSFAPLGHCSISSISYR